LHEIHRRTFARKLLKLTKLQKRENINDLRERERESESKEGWMTEEGAHFSSDADTPKDDQSERDEHRA
jgi:hypothetical protein